MRVTRVGKMFNHKDKEGVLQKGVFAISRSKGYRDYVLTDPANPNIPGTNIPRLRLVHLGGKSVGVDEDEIQPRRPGAGGLARQQGRSARQYRQEEESAALAHRKCAVNAMTEHFGTGTKKGRGKAQRSLDLIEAMYAVAKAAQPITGRGVGYKLFAAGLIPSMERAEMQRVYRLLKEAREQGHIPWAMDRRRDPRA